MAADAETNESEFDLLFPTIPLDDDPSPPEMSQLDLVDDLADFAEDSLPDDYDAESSQDEREDIVMDWATGEFYATENAEPLRVRGADAVIEQVIRRLYTPRGEYAIHDDTYGSDLQRIIGANLTAEVTIAEIDRTTRECVAAHPQIDEVDIQGIAPATSLGVGVWLIAIEVVVAGEPDPITFDLTF